MQLADEIIIGKVESTDKINDLESRMVKCQHDLARSQKLQVSAEAKLKAQSSLHEHKAKSAKEQQSALEQEVAASRCVSLPVGSAGNAGMMCQLTVDDAHLAIHVQDAVRTTEAAGGFYLQGPGSLPARARVSKIEADPAAAADSHHSCNVI